MRILVLIAFLITASCSQKTVKPFTYDDGFTSTQISENTFEISIQGGRELGGQTVGHYFLCKAGEVTLAHGGKYFVIVQRQRNKDEAPHVTIINDKSSSNLSNYLRAAYTPYVNSRLPSTPSRSYHTRYGNIATIRVHNEIPQDHEYYDAELIAAKLTPKVSESVKSAGKAGFFKRILYFLSLANDLTDR